MVSPDFKTFKELMSAAQEVTVTAHRVPSGIEIAVADRGPGIPADDRARALESYLEELERIGVIVDHEDPVHPQECTRQRGRF